MNLQIEVQGQVCKITIFGELTINYIREFYDEVLEAIKNYVVIEMDLFNVTEVDSSGLQLMMLIKRKMNEKSKNLSFINHSEPVLNLLELSNLASFFGDSLVLNPDNQINQNI